MKKIIIITGASSGMGASFARELAARDADEMFLIARRADKLNAVADEIRKTAKMKITPVAADIAKENVIARIAKPGDVIDTLVNNAGFGIYGEFAKAAPEKNSELVAVNCGAMLALCNAALPYLAAGSRIINVASLAAFSPMGGFALYAASKSFALNFSLGLAAELAEKKIKVIALCPGPVDTEFSNVASGGIRESVPRGANPDAVVRHCLRRLERNKKIAIMKTKWKLKAALGRIMPLPFLARFTMKHERRPSAE